MLTTIKAGVLVFGELDKPRAGEEELAKHALRAHLTPESVGHAINIFEGLTRTWRTGVGLALETALHEVPNNDLNDVDYALQLIFDNDKVATPLLADYIKEAPYIGQRLADYLHSSARYLEQHRGLRAELVGVERPGRGL